MVDGGAALEEGEQLGLVADLADDLLVEGEQLGVVGRGGEGAAEDRLGHGVARVVLEGAAHRGDAGVARLGRGEVDLGEAEGRAGAQLGAHGVVGGALDPLEQLDLAGRVAAGGGDAGEAHPGLDEAVALGLDAAVDLGGAVEVAELALDDLGAADQEVGGDHRVGLAAGAFDEGGEAVDVALALAEAGGLLGGGAVQAGGAGGVLDGLEAQAELPKYELQLKYPAQGTAALQNALMDDLVAAGTDAIMISSVDPKTSVEAFNRIAGQVPLFTTDSDAPDSNRIAYLGSSNTAAGVQAGEIAVKALPKGGKCMGFVGFLGADNAKERIAGFKQAVRERDEPFGDFGLKCTDRGRLTARQIEAARRAISRHVKRGGRIWIRVFPDKPISQKPAEVRMGNGKGNPEYYVAEIQPGKVLYEIQGVPEELAREAFKLAAAKLPLSTTFVGRQFGI